jgi:small GTP-binding protein
MSSPKKNEKYDFMAKVIIIGDSGIGKTVLITRFCESTFKESYVATIGVDFKIKTMTVGNRRYKMQIWDTAGQERFKNITQTYYKGAAGIILTYSIVDRNSFENIDRWMTQIDNNAPADVSKILIATKADLNYERQVTTEEGAALASKFSMRFAEVSAKSGTNVKEGFEMLIEEIHKKWEGKNPSVTPSGKELTLDRKDKETERKRCEC